MHEDPQYFAKRKPARCPNCKSKTVVPIVYGLPTPEAFEDEKKGKLVLGGCIVGPFDPSWKCTSCGIQIYKEERR